MTSFTDLMKRTKKPKYALSNMQIQEISLVTVPASTGADISFVKSAQMPDSSEYVQFQKAAGEVRTENRGPSDLLLDAVKGKQKPGETPYDTIARLHQDRDPDLNAAYSESRKRRLDTQQSARRAAQPASTVAKADRLSSAVQEQIQKAAGSGQPISEQEALTRAVQEPDLYRAYRELMDEGLI